MEEQRKLTLEQAAEKAEELTNLIMEKFENNDPAARDRLFHQSLVTLMENNTVMPPEEETLQEEPRWSRSWGRQHG
jgi:hypothetical protein